ncbi:MAG: FecR domain-containing protein [Sphingobium sp.]|nr:FecR domain-containing protein [Sphingobium sp.]
MTRIADQIADQAIDWHLRQDDMDASAWHRFVEWLEADPRHAEAYDRIALAGGAAGIVQAPKLPEPANDRGYSGWNVGRWMAGAAACAAAVVAVVVLQPAKPDIYTVQTASGETRQVALGDGSRVEISGGSRLSFDRAHPRQVTVERGAALFHVRHDESDPFIVRSGRLEVLDVGTVFNVARDGKRFSVAVAEGSVMFQPKREAVTLAAGAALSVDEDRREVQVVKVDPGLVGGWRTGRFAYSATPVSQILDEIQRLYGTKVVADRGLYARRVTGMITLSGEAQRDVPHIASLIGANWRADGERWVLTPVGENRP